MLDYKQISKHLPIARNRLDDELEMQAVYTHMVGEKVAEWSAARRKARDALDGATAKESRRLKQEDPKITITAAEQQTRLAAEWKDARDVYNRESKEP